MMTAVVGWLRNDPTRHVVRLATDSGREYDLILVRAVHLSGERIPAVMVEHPDGSIFFGGRSFSSVDEACREFGCIIVEFVTVDLPN